MHTCIYLPNPSVSPRLLDDKNLCMYSWEQNMVVIVIFILPPAMGK